MPKSKDAFRTISEVADWLETQPHVLRFWESKFTQVRPVKRAGGRRYYRPADMLLLGGIKKLLHDDGMTIKGVQKLLREKGIKQVSSFSRPLDDDAEAFEIKNAEIAREIPEAIARPDVDPLEAEIAALKLAQAETEAASSAPDGVQQPDIEAPVADAAPPEPPKSQAPAEDALPPMPETEHPASTSPKPKKPLADVSVSWALRKKLLDRLVKIEDVENANRPAIAAALIVLKELLKEKQTVSST